MLTNIFNETELTDSQWCLIWGNMLSAETEQITCQSNDMFLPVEMHHPDAHNRLSWISLPG